MRLVRLPDCTHAALNSASKKTLCNRDIVESNRQAAKALTCIVCKRIVKSAKPQMPHSKEAPPVEPEPIVLSDSDQLAVIDKVLIDWHKAFLWFTRDNCSVRALDAMEPFATAMRELAKARYEKARKMSG